MFLFGENAARKISKNEIKKCKFICDFMLLKRVTPLLSNISGLGRVEK